MQSTRDNAIVELFCQVINESSFNVLRTQEQLGYIVASGVRNYGGAQGVRLIRTSHPLFLTNASRTLFLVHTILTYQIALHYAFFILGTFFNVFFFKSV